MEKCINGVENFCKVYVQHSPHPPAEPKRKAAWRPFTPAPPRKPGGGVIVTPVTPTPPQKARGSAAVTPQTPTPPSTPAPPRNRGARRGTSLQPAKTADKGKEIGSTSLQIHTPLPNPAESLSLCLELLTSKDW